MEEYGPVWHVLSGFSDGSSCVSRRAFVDCAARATAHSSRALDSVRRSTGVQSAGYTTAARTGPCGNSPAARHKNQPFIVYNTFTVEPALCACF